MTNLELAEEEAQDREYCGNVSHLPKARTTLPCFKVKIQGRPGLALLDTGATTNFVDQTFLKRHPRAVKKESSTTICLADGTAREQCSTHHHLTIELGSSVTTVKAVEMKLLHFDAILGIPWLLKIRPVFNWDEQAIILTDEVIRPFHQVPRKELPEDFAQVESKGTLSEEKSGRKENKDVTPLEAATPKQLEAGFNPTARLEQCFQ